MLIRQLEYVVALARERHFGRAAEACHVSQPALSTAIRKLERELGTPIVRRGARYEGLTSEGERVLAWAGRILADRDLMRDDLGSLAGGLTGRLRLGVIPTALPATARLTVPFSAAHPRVTVEVLSLSSIEIARRLQAFELDAGLTYLDNEPLRGVRTVPVYVERYVLLTPVGGAFDGLASVGWLAASQVPLCLLTPDMQNRRIVDAVFAGVGVSPVPEVETNSVTTLCTHVASGRWSSVLPGAWLDAIGVPAGTAALPLVDPEVTHQVGLVLPARDPESRLVRALRGVVG